MNFIFGTGGFAKEVNWLAEDIYQITGSGFRTDFFVDQNSSFIIGKLLNEKEVMPEEIFFLKYKSEHVNCFIGVGNPQLKHLIIKNIRVKTKFPGFPNLVHPSLSFDNRKNKLTLGCGNIICSNNVITTDVDFGNFITLNISCTVGHDTIIGDYTTISPGVNISGNVKIGNKVFIGTGSSIIESISICDDVIIGAGAVVTKNINTPGIYVGIPAKEKINT
jgi:sugar O-acyltransferase (sialic acid O-acetyltransferase NeuD family)